MSDNDIVIQVSRAEVRTICDVLKRTFLQIQAERDALREQVKELENRLAQRLRREQGQNDKPQGLHRQDKGVRASANRVADLYDLLASVRTLAELGR